MPQLPHSCLLSSEKNEVEVREFGLPLHFWHIGRVVFHPTIADGPSQVKTSG